MVRWGVVWGAVLGLFWPGYQTEWHCVIGAILGGLSGLMLRSAVQQELRKASPDLPARPVAVPIATPAPASATPTHAAPATRSEDFQATAPASLPAEPVSPSLPRVHAPAPASPQPSRDPVTTAILAARDWLLGGNTIVRLGLLVLFVGLAFLAKYAVDNALLPPQLRLAAVAAAGIGLFVAGWRLRGRAGKRGYALSLQGAGVAVLYLTVFASFRLYQFLPAGAAFAALALVCAFSAFIAVAQNSQAMAVIGFAGGYAAPLLVSTGQGSHVALFAYDLVLGLAITAIAWWRAWRPLNLLGFFATFGVATAWGVLRYVPAQFASTEPFLVAYFLLFVAAAVLYATRHQLSPNRAVDGTLVFGVPMACTVLQGALVRDIPFGGAYSALAAGAFYLLLTSRMAVRAARGDEAARWLGECFIALGLGFVTLAVPLAIDPTFTAGVWAIEGLAVFWLGARQGRWVPRVAGLVLQVLAAAAFMHALPRSGAHEQFFGALQLAAAAMLLAWWSRAGARQATPGLDSKVRSIEVALSPILFWVAFLWLQDGLWAEIGRTVVQIDGTRAPILEAAAQSHLALLAWVATAFAVHGLAAPIRPSPWPVARTPALTVLPVLFIGAIVEAANFTHVFTAGGWMVWPLLLVLHGLMLRRLDAGPPQGWWSLVHAAGVWLLVLLGGNVLVFAVSQAHLWRTAWASVVLLVSATVALLVLARPMFHRQGARWPLDRFARAYGLVAAAPLAVAVAIGALVVAIHSEGRADPLPYVPLLNPTDLAVALALLACTAWLAQLRRGAVGTPAPLRTPAPVLALAAIAFIAVNTIWLRIAHHWAGVPWDAGALYASFLVQAGYSILWTALALGVMVVAHRRESRRTWMAGAGLLAFTVAKLFLVDLSNRGGSERIVVFIAVGLLMLVVGYVAPLPPTATRVREAAT